MLALEAQNVSELCMSDRELGVELNRLPSEPMRTFEGSGAQIVFIQPQGPSKQVSKRKRRIGARVVRVEGDGALEELPSLIEVYHLERRPHRGEDIRSAHEEIIRLPGRRRLQQRALGLGLVDLGHQDRNDRPGNLVLNSEDVLQLAVVTLGPKVSAGQGIDELGGDADAIAGPTDAAFENVANAELAADLPYIR